MMFAFFLLVRRGKNEIARNMRRDGAEFSVRIAFAFGYTGMNA